MADSLSDISSSYAKPSTVLPQLSIVWLITVYKHIISWFVAFLFFLIKFKWTSYSLLK